MDATAREAQGGLEWRVTVPEGASVAVEHEAGAAARAWAWALARVAAAWSAVAGLARKVWRIGADDPRRAVHGLKVALALALVSVFYYSRPLYDGVGGAAMWAIMTIVVVFEYTVGESIASFFFKRWINSEFAAALQSWRLHQRACKCMAWMCDLDLVADCLCHVSRWQRVQVFQQSRGDGERRRPRARRALGGRQNRQVRAVHPHWLPLFARYVSSRVQLWVPAETDRSP